MIIFRKDVLQFLKRKSVKYLQKTRRIRRALVNPSQVISHAWEKKNFPNVETRKSTRTELDQISALAQQFVLPHELYPNYAIISQPAVRWEAIGQSRGRNSSRACIYLYCVILARAESQRISKGATPARWINARRAALGSPFHQVCEIRSAAVAAAAMCSSS